MVYESVRDVFEVFIKLDDKKTDYGIIGIRVDNFFFPEPTWSDFAVSIMMEWLKNASRLKTSKTEQHFFNEGYRFFKTQLLHADQVEITFFEGSGAGKNRVLT